MCLCLSVSHRSSSSSSNTSFILVSPIPLVSNLTEKGESFTHCTVRLHPEKIVFTSPKWIFTCRRRSRCPAGRRPWPAGWAHAGAVTRGRSHDPKWAAENETCLDPWGIRADTKQCSDWKVLIHYSQIAQDYEVPQLADRNIHILLGKWHYTLFIFIFIVGSEPVLLCLRRLFSDYFIQPNCSNRQMCK